MKEFYLLLILLCLSVVILAIWAFRVMRKSNRESKHTMKEARRNRENLKS